MAEVAIRLVTTTYSKRYDPQQPKITEKNKVHIHSDQDSKYTSYEW